jgi:hypothetical protein
MHLLRQPITAVVPFILLLVLLAPPAGQAATFGYARGFGGPSTDQALAIAVDEAGNAYLAGPFNGTVDFDPGPGTVNLTSLGSTDAFVVKLDPSGNLAWARSFGGTGSDVAQGVAVDSTGNVYVTGYFAGAVDFDPGAGTNILVSSGLADAFVVKLDPSGNLISARSVGGLGFDQALAVAVDGAGAVYLAGAFDGTADFEPGSGTFNLTSAGSADAFVLKLGPNGGFNGVRSFGGTSLDQATALALDGLGNVHIAGFFFGTADFDPGAGTLNLTSAGVVDAFVVKLDPSGTLVWAKQVGGTSSDQPAGVATDSSGNVYLTGRFAGTADFDPGPGTFELTATDLTDPFALKLAADGTLVWARQLAATVAESGGFGVAVDGGGNVYIVGEFLGTADFDPGPGIVALTAAGSVDTFAVKLDAAGNLVWARSVGGTGGDAGHALALDVAGGAYLAGGFAATADFDPGSGIANLTSAGALDAFVLKLVQVSPPVNTVPGPQTATVNTPLTFSTAGANRISVADADAGSSPARVTLVSTNGTLTLATTAGLSFSQGDGTADSTMTFTGTLTAINAALEGLLFAPSPGFAGDASLRITTNDLIGPTGGQVDDDMVPITVLATTCEPRPRVRTLTAAGGGRLQVHVEATPLNTQASNLLQQVTFDRLDNARVTLNGQPMASGQAYVPATSTSALDFTVERITAGQPTTVHVTVTDGCGTWRTFVGGGAGAAF